MEVCSHNCFDPNTVLLKINGVRCNLNCEYCSEIRKDLAVSMNENECAEIISQLPATCEIILHGGEPLLDENTVMSAIKSFRKKSTGRKLSLQTNGYLNDKMKQILLENADILRIGISIDGNFEQNIMRKDRLGNSVFHHVDSTISFFEKNNIDIKCISTVNSANVHSATDMMEYF